MKTYLYSYKTGSNSASNLSDLLDIKRIRRQNSKFVGNTGKTVINWGASKIPTEVRKCNIINDPSAVGLCSNKLSFFETIKADNERLLSVDPDSDIVNIPEFTTSKSQAEAWHEEGSIVINRGSLNGQGGAGIYMSDQEGILDGMPLYVKYIPKRNEYRVHVFAGEVLSIQRKALSRGINRNENTFRVRNHANGFIFARNEDHTPPPQVGEQALLAMEAINGLTFGAVDVIWNEHRGKAYILEINTAPGLEGTTLEEYVNKFREVI